MNDVLSKVNFTIDVIDKSDIVSRLKELRLLMDNESDVQHLLNDFNVAKKEYSDDSSKTENLLITKEALYKHPVVSEYRKLYAELNLCFVKFNQSLSSLLHLKKHECSKR